MRTLILILFCVATSNLAAETKPSLQQVQALVKASGLEMQLNQIPATLRQSTQDRSIARSSIVGPLMESLQSVFDAKEMQTILTEDLISRLDVPTLLDAMAWYNSTNGKEIIQAHQSMMQPEIMEEVATTLSSNGDAISPQRQLLVNRLVKSTQSVETALDLMATMQAAFMSGMSAMIAPSQTKNFETLRSSLSRNKDLLRDQVVKQLQIQQAVIYQNVSDETLEEFLAFSNSRSGQTLFNALNASLNQTLMTVAQRIPTALANSGSQVKPIAKTPTSSR